MCKITLIILIFITTLICAQVVDPKDKVNGKENGNSNGKANGKDSNINIDNSNSENGNNKGKGRGKNAKFVRLKKIRLNEETFG